MANGTWKRSTSARRRAERRVRYAHVSAAVGVGKDEVTGMLIPTRTPKGQGSTATRITPKAAKVKRHDWPGEYPGRLASVEAAARFRRSAARNARFASKALDARERRARAAARRLPVVIEVPRSDLSSQDELWLVL